jgi:hypothetical protein
MLPRGQTKGFVVENEIVSLFPQAPSSNHNNLHEEEPGKILLGNVDLLVDDIFFPGHANSKPTANNSRAIKEEVLSHFFNINLTYDAILAFI